jgi:3-isopropylmalate/(R)-2-methylmalate dehydratase large subunit
MPQSLFEKVWAAHTVKKLANGQTQLLIGTHLIHEVTSPQAFGMLRDLGLKVLMPHRTFATVDHIIPTNELVEPYQDALAQAMMDEVRKNCAQFGITFFDRATGKQGIVHIVGPEQGITQPGTTIACGDSHTSTHGAFGAIAFGIGTSQVRDVLATQTMALGQLKVRRIKVNGRLGRASTPRTSSSTSSASSASTAAPATPMNTAAPPFDGFTMEERMTVCNMSIEGGARVGYVNPDETTFAYLKGRPYSPTGAAWDAAVEGWKSFASDPGAKYDDVVKIDAARHRADRHLGHQSRPGHLHRREHPEPGDRHLGRRQGRHHRGPRLHETARGPADQGHQDRRRLPRLLHQRPPLDFREVAKYIKGRKVAAGVKAIAVPGSQIVALQCEREGIDKVLSRGRLRMARRRLLDVPRDEPRQAHRRPALRQLLQPQLQGPPRLAHRPHRADEPGHGRRRRRHRRRRRRA